MTELYNYILYKRHSFKQYETLNAFDIFLKCMNNMFSEFASNIYQPDICTGCPWVLVVRQFMWFGNAAYLSIHAPTRVG